MTWPCRDNMRSSNHHSVRRASVEPTLRFMKRREEGLRRIRELVQPTLFSVYHRHGNGLQCVLFDEHIAAFALAAQQSSC